MKKESIALRQDKVIVSNRKAGYEYELLDRFEAGIELKGTEVKSLREGKANLVDCYATVKEEEVWLLNCHISEYEQGNRFNHDPRRPRKLLLHKSEIRRLLGKIKERGYTLVPLALYFHANKVKVELALAKGKKTHDRKDAIQDRDARRDMARAIKEHHR